MTTKVMDNVDVQRQCTQSAFENITRERESIDHSWVKFSQRSVGTTCKGFPIELKIWNSIWNRIGEKGGSWLVRPLKYPRLWSIDFVGSGGKWYKMWS